MVPRSLPALRHATALFSYFSFIFVFLLSSFVLFLVLSFPLLIISRDRSYSLAGMVPICLIKMPEHSLPLLFWYSSPMPSSPFYCTVPVASIRNGGALHKRAFPIPHSTGKSRNMPKQKPDQTSTALSERPQGGLQVSNASHTTWVIVHSTYLVHSLRLSV